MFSLSLSSHKSKQKSFPFSGSPLLNTSNHHLFSRVLIRLINLQREENSKEKWGGDENGEEKEEARTTREIRKGGEYKKWEGMLQTLSSG